MKDTKEEKLYLSCLIRNDLICSEVTFITNQKLVHVFACISIYFIQPLLNIIEAILVRNIIHNLYTLQNIIGKQASLLEDKKAGNKCEQRRERSHYNYAMSSTVVAASNCSKTFLTGSIPLQLMMKITN